jgi:hypothetical protein
MTCIPERGLDKGAVIGVSFSTSLVGLLLLSYCLYVSWYGRWGLPKLKRVSSPVLELPSLLACLIDRLSE